MEGGKGFESGPGKTMVTQDKIKRARGDLAPFPEPGGADMPAGLRGTPFYAKFVGWNPVDDAGAITVPTLIVDAELEHYFDNANNGLAAHQKIKGNAPTDYHEIKGMKHYDVYVDPHLKEVMQLEIAWFDKYLK